jgi:hypothetical protein
MSEARITVEEMVAEMDRLRAREPAVLGLTTAEWARVWGYSQPIATRMIREYIAAGVMRYAGEKRVLRMDNRPMDIPCYAPVVPAKKKR